MDSKLYGIPDSKIVTVTRSIPTDCDICKKCVMMALTYNIRGKPVRICRACIDRIIEEFLAARGTEGSE